MREKCSSCSALKVLRWQIQYTRVRLHEFARWESSSELPDAFFQEAGGLHIWRLGPGEWKQILPLSRGALFPSYVYAFFFPCVCDSSLAQAPSVRGAGEMDGWEGCIDGETVAAVMWCNSWYLHKDGEFRQPRSGGNSPGTMTLTSKLFDFQWGQEITKRRLLANFYNNFRRAILMSKHFHYP